jgi:hypothetical protein
MKLIRYNFFFFSLCLHELGPLACANSELILKSESYKQSVGLLGRGISTSQSNYLHRKTQIQNKCRQTLTPRVGFETKIPVFERDKTFRVLGRAAKLIGLTQL